MGYLDHRPLYNTKRWRQLRERVLKRDGWVCVLCRAGGVVTAAEEVDHIEPALVALEHFWDVDNLQALCRRCHCEKTSSEKRERTLKRKRVKFDLVTGRPVSGRNA